jgi:hypothetical protein
VVSAIISVTMVTSGSGSGFGVRIWLRRGVAEELLQVMAGDEPASANLDVGQVTTAHLVVEQVAGQAGQAGGFVDGVGQPCGWVWFWLAVFESWRTAGSARAGLTYYRGCQAGPGVVPDYLMEEPRRGDDRKNALGSS